MAVLVSRSTGHRANGVKKDIRLLLLLLLRYSTFPCRPRSFRKLTFDSSSFEPSLFQYFSLSPSFNVCSRRSKKIIPKPPTTATHLTAANERTSERAAFNRLSENAKRLVFSRFSLLASRLVFCCWNIASCCVEMHKRIVVVCCVLCCFVPMKGIKEEKGQRPRVSPLSVLSRRPFLKGESRDPIRALLRRLLHSTLRVE